MFEAFTIRQQDRIFARDSVKAVAVQPPDAGTGYDKPTARQAAIVQGFGQTIGAPGGNVDGVMS
jgi:hypothetical protein